MIASLDCLNIDESLLTILERLTVLDNVACCVLAVVHVEHLRISLRPPSPFQCASSSLSHSPELAERSKRIFEFHE